MKNALFCYLAWIMAGLTLSVADIHAVFSGEFSASFNLKAIYTGVTCKTVLGTHGDLNGTVIDFGTLSPETERETSKKVVLVLDCSDSELPYSLNINFQVVKGIVDGHRLYPVLDGSDNKITRGMYYNWSWGHDVDKFVSEYQDGNILRGVIPGEPVELTAGAGNKSYDLVPRNSTATYLELPLDITRKVVDFSSLEAGDYTAGVTVTISYE